MPSGCNGFRTRPPEGRRPGSTAGEDITIATLEPDGQATGCNPVQVGSTPTGVSRGGPRAAVQVSGKRLCADAETARLLASDGPLNQVCHPAGERLLVFRAEDEVAVRARLRK